MHSLTIDKVTEQTQSNLWQRDCRLTPPSSVVFVICDLVSVSIHNQNKLAGIHKEYCVDFSASRCTTLNTQAHSTYRLMRASQGRGSVKTYVTLEV